MRMAIPPNRKTTTTSNMANNITAVEWLENKINDYDYSQGMTQMRKYIQMAKSIEQKIIELSYVDGRIDVNELKSQTGEQYYNEVYGKQEDKL